MIPLLSIKILQLNSMEMMVSKKRLLGKQEKQFTPVKG